MKGILRIVLAFMLVVGTFPAYAEEKEVPQIDFRKELLFHFRPNLEPWKPKAHEANAESPPVEKKKLTKRDKVALVVIGVAVVIGTALTIYSERENARSGNGTICCRSIPYVEDRPPTTQEPGGGDGGGFPP
jgi:hypothetical protein